MDRAEKRRQQKLAEKAKKSKARNKPEEGQLQNHQQLAQALELAMDHHEADRISEAEAIYRDILEVEPVHPVAKNLLGAIAFQNGNKKKAWTLITQALDVAPDYPEAHSNLGHLLRDLERLEEAVVSYQKALALKPDFVKTHYSLGNVLKDLGKLEEAVASYHKVLAIDPIFAKAHYKLGLTLQELGRGEAIKSFRHAVSLNPKNDLFWTGLAACVETCSFTSADDQLWEDLLFLLEWPKTRASQLIRPIISALLHHPDFSKILELKGFEKPEVGIDYGDIVERLSEIPLFLRIMEVSPISDLKIERMLTVLRRNMLKEEAGKAVEKGLAFSAILALQCFTNEYVFSETDEEKAAVEDLQIHIAALVEKQRDVPPSLVATLGAYRPLYRFPWAQELCERNWEGNIKDVVERQISEPLEERSVRPQIPHLTPIQNAISQSVRDQYEENPYPRWIKTGIRDKGNAIGAYLQGAPLHLNLGDYLSPENPEILVAGCGTGQHSLSTATSFSNARVLALDLSLSSLSYALRKTKELDISNIEYAQGDIMELGRLGRRFDLIECVGVLHHLGDPLAGWRLLVDLLHPGGLMKIGLYSEIARKDVSDGRSLIAEKGYTTTVEDIRLCRQDIIAKAEDGNQKMTELCNIIDFFSLSECRDLLFHVQEHLFTLPQIEEDLETLNLKFLGFEMRNRRSLREFGKMYPNDDTLTSLSLWHEFELNNPDTFGGMYQFWCKKL